MVTLLLVLCLHGQCVDRPAVTDTAPGLVGCMIAGQRAGAEWERDHPFQVADGWRFSGWRCQWGKPAEKAA